VRSLQVDIHTHVCLYGGNLFMATDNVTRYHMLEVCIYSSNNDVSFSAKLLKLGF
jgi:hypothetical protein